MTWIIALLSLRAVLALTRAFLPPNNPHAHRQTDTLAVSMRYFSRWFLEDNLRQPLLPAVLNAGDAYGIMRMELPLLNLLGAPAFALGPDLGQIAACIIVFTWHALLLFANYRVWRHIQIGNINAGIAVLLLPLLSIGDQYYSRYMPDVTAMSLVLLAIGLSWHRPRLFWSTILAAVGMSIKPPAVALFGLLLLRPKWWEWLVWPRPWVSIALLAPAL